MRRTGIGERTLIRRVTKPLILIAFGAVLGMAGAEALHAQGEAIKRTPLQRADLTDIPGREAIMGMAEIAPGAAAGRHTHFGFELGYMLEGTTTLEIEGQAPTVIKAGDSYQIPAGKAHDAKNIGSGPAKVLAIYIVEKGKPLATAAQ